MCKTLRIMKIIHSSAVDGEGFRDTLYVNYCPHHCPGCHNPQTWDKKNGREVSIKEIYDDLMQSNVTNVTYSGGEPFCQAQELAVLTKMIKKASNKNFWIYSGYTYEQIIADPVKLKLLSLCDVLVDGKFEQKYFKENLRFRGSENQRIIDIKKSLANGDAMLWKG